MLNAISPIDGRYADKTSTLSQYFSEYALIRQRVAVEIAYLIGLSKLGITGLTPFSAEESALLRSLATNFSVADAEQVKTLETRTNHDVKAVEYFIKERLVSLHLSSWKEWVHFALTSQDINNTAVPVLFRDSLTSEIIPSLEGVLAVLRGLEESWQGIPLLARTHGQPASPTTMSKELRVFSERLDYQLNTLRRLPHYGKFGGATGNFNAHLVAFPEVDWRTFADELLNELGLQRIQTTTQIDHYDHLAELLQCLTRICTIMIDLCRDIWTYISMDYIIQNVSPGEVGSSTMPHKVNPIDFENGEGNLGIAIALFQHFAVKLPVSRLQRDLTDSTVLRNVGVPCAHLLIAIKSVVKGLGKLRLNEARLHADLEANWAVVTEAIQTILRREGVENPYELLKELSRGNHKLTRETLLDFIEGLQVSERTKSELRTITPMNYTGYQ